MRLATLRSRATLGVAAPEVTVEVHVANGLPAFSIVGLPEAAVRESKDRVRGALQNSGFEFPAQRITVNLAPADLPKEGGRYDLPIALGLLAAMGHLPVAALAEFEFYGELALSGEVRGVSGLFPALVAAIEAGRQVILPQANQHEAAMLTSGQFFSCASLTSVVQHFHAEASLSQVISTDSDIPELAATANDLEQVRGQALARRALMLAAAGGHNMLMVGPPGSGKTLLASCLPGILPALEEREAREVAAVWSVSQQGYNAEHWRRRPFRNPHHTSSAVALVGGGSQARPGEISLAHNGVLFLDELPEYDRKVLEVLREPLESGEVHISRAARQVSYPARFQLIAAMNPCPCGYLGDASGQCHCTEDQVQRYRNKISGPLLDRIDMQLEVPRQSQQLLLNDQTTTPEESSATVRAQVQQARQRQLDRQGCINSLLSQRALEQYCELTHSDKQFLVRVMDKMNLSMRAYHRTLRLARSIADVDAQAQINMSHLSEALMYRRMDKKSLPGLADVI